MDITQEAFEKSTTLLEQLVTDKGFLASAEEITNYRRVWSRDGVIAGLASLQIDNNELHATFKATLQTLARHQDHTGRIPSNVSLDESSVSYGTTVGRVDATLWYIIGVCQYSLQRGDYAFFESLSTTVEKAMFYMECLELNGRGLVYIPQGGDWADEYITHAYVLFDQALYYVAQRSYFALTQNKHYEERANQLAQLIRINYFPKKENIDDPNVYSKALFEMSLEHYRPPLPLAYFSAHRAENHRIATFDTALLLVLDIIDNEAKTAISTTVFSQCTPEDFPVLPAFSPVIDENDGAWNDLTSNYLFSFKNEPYKFHNGGLWPLVHGFFLAGSAPFEENPRQRLYDFAQTLKRDNYIFPEYYHGLTYEALGTKQLSFSASGYILAHSKTLYNKPYFVF